MRWMKWLAMSSSPWTAATYERLPDSTGDSWRAQGSRPLHLLAGTNSDSGVSTLSGMGAI